MDGNLRQQIFRPTACLNHEELRQYLRGSMTREGQRRVEDHLLDCPLCSDAVDGCGESGGYHANDLEDFDAFIKKLPAEAGSAKVRQLNPVSGYLRQAIAIAAILIVGAVAYFRFFQAPSGEELFAKYYDPYEVDIPVTMRHAGLSDVNPNFAQALAAYSDGKFSQSIMLFERAIQAEPDNEAARFYAGLAYLESNQADKADENLRAVAKGTSVYANQASWYAALNALKAGKIDDARLKLDEIIAKGKFMPAEAQSLREKL